MSRTSRAEWAKRVERWKDSGLTAKEFAAEAGLKASTLSYWKWKLDSEDDERGSARGGTQGKRRRRHAATSVPKVGFVELSTSSLARSGTTTTESMLELVLGGVLVRVPVGFDEAMLTRLVRALQAAR